MKLARIAGLVCMAVLLIVPLVYAGGDAERGKSLFNDPTLGGSTNARSCNTCHPGGSGIEKAGTKKYTRFMGIAMSTLEEVVNTCIEKPLKGKALDTNSQDMQDIVAYIKSLGK
jgi:cytochrome c